MSFVVDDTIAAIASARGPGARAIIRLSGPDVAGCLRQCFVSPADWEHGKTPSVTTGAIRLTAVAADLPCDLYFWPTSRSYTKQPAAELHLLGSVPLAEAALDSLCQSGARLARPGEFTMRAFLAGRIDLPQAEAVLGVIDATNQRALDRALKQLAGGLSSELGQLRDQVLDLLADIEAGLDFVEEDIEFVSEQEIVARLAAAAEVTEALLGKMHSRATTATTIKAVLLGLPNVGKSSLFNALCNQQAIVSRKSGTTRDYVEGSLNSMGHAEAIDCRVIDTAGVAVGSTEIAALGSQQVTQTQWQDADLLILCLDASRPLSKNDQSLLDATRDSARLVVETKADLLAGRSRLLLLADDNVMQVSSVTGEGVTDLVAAICDLIRSQQDEETQVVQCTVQRCRSSLEATMASFHSAIALAREAAGNELLAAELRGGLDHLGQIVGAVYTDDVLDRIFGRFCIGK